MRYAHPSKRQTPKATTVWRLDLSLEKFRVASSGGRKRRGGIWASVRLTILFGPALKNSKTRRMRFANLFSALLESNVGATEAGNKPRVPHMSLALRNRARVLVE